MVWTGRGTLMRVFLDANVVYSAAASAGAIRRLLEDLCSCGHMLVVDAYVWEEARRNLSRRSSGSVAVLHTLGACLELHDSVHVGDPVSSVASEGTADLPEKDRPVLRAAIALRCDLLMTGGRTHFGSLYGKRIGSILVQSPVGVAEQLLSR